MEGWYNTGDIARIEEMPTLGTGKLDMKQLKTIAAERVEAKTGERRFGKREE